MSSILVGAPKVVCDLKDVRVPTTGQTSFNVEAVCEGSLMYVWQRKASNSTEWEGVSSDTKYQGQSTPSLVVTNVEKSDEGLIRCLVSSEGGQTYTREAFLRIGWFSSFILHIIICSYDLFRECNCGGAAAS